MFGHLTKVVPVLCLVFASTAHADDGMDCGVLPSSPWQLSRLLPIVARCNRDVIAAQAMLAAADADVRIAAQRPNPTLTLGVSNINAHAGIGAGNLLDKTVDSSVRIDQLIERGGKAGLRMDVAGKALQASRADLDTVIRQQQATFLKAWYAAEAATERRNLLTELLALNRQSEALAVKRVQAGDLPANDLTRISLDSLRAENDLHQAESDWREAGLTLARLLGAASLPGEPVLEPVWPDTAAIPPADDALIEKRPDITALRARAESARAARDLARAQAHEDVSVGLQADHWPTSSTNMQGTGNSLSLSVSFPIALRHRHQGEIQRAEADYRIAQEALDSARLSARNDLFAIHSAVEAARRSLVTLQSQIIPASRQIAARAETAYAKGASSVLDLLDSRRMLRQVSLDGVAARLDYAQSLADWQLATGDRPDSPAITVSSSLPVSVKESR